MITKITSDNKGLYQKLFLKADKAMGNPEGTIQSLEQFFTKYSSLADLNNAFKVLPLDEPTFDINADTRVITVPDSFKKNGISVQGDQIAEIVYFTIDRFYDNIDLFDPVTETDSEGVHVIIQWEAAPKAGSKNATATKGISPAYLVDKEILKSQNKLLIGWDINNVITENPGTIKFSVRFYRIQNGQDNKKVMTFSLSTLTATATINPGLDFKFDGAESAEKIYDNSQLIKNRYRDSAYAGDPEETDPPVFKVQIIKHADDCIDHITITNADNEEIEYHIIDLDENNQYHFSVQAEVNEGRVGYAWKHRPLDQDSFDSVTGADEYIPTEDTVVSNAKIYYTKIADGVYDVYDGTGEIMQGEADTEKIYEKFNSYTATSTGDYFVIAKNLYGLAHADTNSLFVRIPGPGELEVEVDENLSTILDENGEVTLEVTASTGEDRDSIIYSWIDSEGNEVSAAAVYSVPAVAEEDRAMFDETFTLSVVASRNGDSTDPEVLEFRVTDKAHEPLVARDNESLDLSGKEGSTIDVTATISTEGILSDAVEYRWYKVLMDYEDNDLEKEDINDRTNDLPLGEGPVVISAADFVANQAVATITVTNEGKYYCKVINHVNDTESEEVYSDAIRVTKL